MTTPLQAGRPRLTRAVTFAACATALAASAPAVARPKAPALRFTAPRLVDAARAGGEPTVVALPDGDLLYAAHAQLTHYHAPHGADPTAVTPFRGQSYVWRSSDRGATWTPTELPLTGMGSSDPDFSIDAAGNVYFAEITPTQTTVARSADSGRTWTANPAAAVVYDREWLAAGARDEVFMSGKLGLDVIPAILRSGDGGVTWTVQGTDEIGEYPVNKLWYDRRGKVLYHPFTTGRHGGATHDVGVSVSTDAGRTWTHRRAATIGRLIDISAPPATIDRAGRVYLALPSTDARGDTRLQLVTSADRGVTWSKPITLSTKGGVLFPWLVAGDTGRVGAAWLCADRPVPDAEDHPAAWSVCSAVVTGAGTAKPVAHLARVTPRPVHVGQVCVQGITCEPLGIDRRLGEFITVAPDADGSLLVAWSDTRTYPGSAVARPGFARQTSGPRLYAR